MSHDRGCFKCHNDPCTYSTCADPQCPKRPRTAHLNKPAPLNIVDRTDSEGGVPGRAFSTLVNTRPHCLQCQREQPQWQFCPNEPEHCPIRAAYVRNRPATRIISVREPGYEIVMFFNPDGGAQAIISRPGDKEPTDVLIAPPLPGRRIVVERKGDAFDVTYKDVQS